MNALVLVALLAAVVAPPALPLGAEELGTRVMLCAIGGAWMRAYDTAGDPTNPEIIQIGRTGIPEPMVWLFFAVDSGVREHIYITIPGRPAEEVTIEELERRYPSPCSLPQLSSA